MRFVDTNVLLYAASTSPAEADKARIARTLLDANDLALSVQVLQQFYVQATRPTRTARLSHEQAASLVEAFLRFPAQETTVSLMRAALEAAVRYRISYWDAAIIEAARALSAPSPKYGNVFRAGHPGGRRCSSLTDSRSARLSRLARRAPRSEILVAVFRRRST